MWGMWSCCDRCGSTALIEECERLHRVKAPVMPIGLGKLLKESLVRLVREFARKCVAARMREWADWLVISVKWGMDSCTILRRQLRPKEIE